jgi:hypothetical protein
MENVLDKPEVRTDVIEAMRELASNGQGVREMVVCVQSQLGLKPDALLSVLWYFMKAFDVPLGAVLPIREWLGTGNDQEIDAAILPVIQRTKDRWSPER